MSKLKYTEKSKKTVLYYIGLGSNLGNRLQNLSLAKHWLSHQGSIQKQSSVFESAPWGNVKQNTFYNAVVQFQTNWRPFRLLRKLKAFETQFGRKLSERWGPRLIDLDILLWDGLVIDSPMLSIPHRYLEKRAFVLHPLTEIEPQLILLSGLRAKTLLEQYFADEQIKKIAEKW